MTPPSSPWASVIVPIKDERDNLPPLVASLTKVMDSYERSQSRPYEIIFVDDGSSDGSSEELDRLAKADQRVRVFHFDRNYGKTCALEAGFHQSSGEIIVQIDGDLQQDSEDILKLLPHTATHDVVCGWRQQRQDGLVKKLSSLIANRFRNHFTHDGVHDTGCPLKVFRRPVLERIRLFEGMHRFFPALALMHGFTVKEVPVRHYARMHGVSKYGMGNRLFKSLYDLIAVRWMQQRVIQYKFRSQQPNPAKLKTLLQEQTMSISSKHLMTTETLWLGIGFFGQALFFGRWVVQWIASERNAESRVPVSFWYMSLIGGLITLTYAIYRMDPVFISGQAIGSVVYVRNLVLIHRADQTKSQSPSQT